MSNPSSRQGKLRNETSVPASRRCLPPCLMIPSLLKGPSFDHLVLLMVCGEPGARRDHPSMDTGIMRKFLGFKGCLGNVPSNSTHNKDPWQSSTSLLLQFNNLFLDPCKISASLASHGRQSQGFILQKAMLPFLHSISLFYSPEH